MLLIRFCLTDVVFNRYSGYNSLEPKSESESKSKLLGIVVALHSTCVSCHNMKALIDELHADACCELVAAVPAVCCSVARHGLSRQAGIWRRFLFLFLCLFLLSDFQFPKTLSICNRFGETMRCRNANFFVIICQH